MRAGFGSPDGNEDAPELAGDPALAEPRNVGVDRRAALTEVDPGQIARELLAQRHGQVIVAVDQRRVLEKGARPHERGVLGDERRSAGGDGERKGDGHDAAIHEESPAPLCRGEPRGRGIAAPGEGILRRRLAVPVWHLILRL